MADVRLGQSPFFDRGIEAITARRLESGQTLPELRQLLPPDAKQPHLERLLRQPTLSSYIDQAIAPRLQDRSLLMPQAFRATLRSALKALRQRIDQQKDPRARSARVLARARRVLDEEAELRELAQMYASTLYQG